MSKEIKVSEWVTMPDGIRVTKEEKEEWDWD